LRLQYIADALGFSAALLTVIAVKLQLPLTYCCRFQGAMAQIWVPASFWDANNPRQGTQRAMRLFTSPSPHDAEQQSKDILSIFQTLEHAAAVLTHACGVRLSARSMVMCPLEWSAQLCSELLQHAGGGERAGEEVVCMVPMDAARIADVAEEYHTASGPPSTAASEGKS
jgi:hypothetical protein